MRNLGKALVVGLVLVEVAFAAYLLSPKSDPAAHEPGTITSDSAGLGGIRPQSGAAGSEAGAIGSEAGTAWRGGIADDSASGPTQSTEGRIAVAAIHQAAPAAAASRQQPMPPAPTVQSQALAATPASRDTKTAAALQTGRSREMSRRADTRTVSSSATDELVRESAKLDPALPPPEPFVQDDKPRRSSNTVAAAMTDELVRESAKLDPSLPPPSTPGAH